MVIYMNPKNTPTQYILDVKSSDSLRLWVNNVYTKHIKRLKKNEIIQKKFDFKMFETDSNPTKFT